MYAKLPPEVVEKIRRNYAGGDLNCQALLKLIQTKVAPRALRARNELAGRMASARHRNLSAHKTTGDDETPHYTIFVKNKGHHLRLNRQGVVWQITDGAGRDLGVVPTWFSPGAVWPP